MADKSSKKTSSKSGSKTSSKSSSKGGKRGKAAPTAAPAAPASESGRAGDKFVSALDPSTAQEEPHPDMAAKRPTQVAKRQLAITKPATPVKIASSKAVGEDAAPVTSRKPASATTTPAKKSSSGKEKKTPAKKKSRSIDEDDGNDVEMDVGGDSKHEATSSTAAADDTQMDATVPHEYEEDKPFASSSAMDGKAEAAGATSSSSHSMDTAVGEASDSMATMTVTISKSSPEYKTMKKSEFLMLLQVNFRVAVHVANEFLHKVDMTMKARGVVIKTAACKPIASCQVTTEMALDEYAYALSKAKKSNHGLFANECTGCCCDCPDNKRITAKTHTELGAITRRPDVEFLQAIGMLCSLVSQMERWLNQPNATPALLEFNSVATRFEQAVQTFPALLKVTLTPLATYVREVSLQSLPPGATTALAGSGSPHRSGFGAHEHKAFGASSASAFGMATSAAQQSATTGATPSVSPLTSAALAAAMSVEFGGDSKMASVMSSMLSAASSPFDAPPPPAGSAGGEEAAKYRLHTGGFKFITPAPATRPSGGTFGASSKFSTSVQDPSSFGMGLGGHEMGRIPGIGSSSSRAAGPFVPSGRNVSSYSHHDEKHDDSSMQTDEPPRFGAPQQAMRNRGIGSSSSSGSAAVRSSFQRPTGSPVVSAFHVNGRQQQQHGSLHLPDDDDDGGRATHGNGVLEGSAKAGTADSSMAIETDEHSKQHRGAIHQAPVASAAGAGTAGDAMLGLSDQDFEPDVGVTESNGLTLPEIKHISQTPQTDYRTFTVDEQAAAAAAATARASRRAAGRFGLSDDDPKDGDYVEDTSGLGLPGKSDRILRTHPVA